MLFFPSILLYGRNPVGKAYSGKPEHYDQDPKCLLVENAVMHEVMA